ncbi:MAG: hypothetical protein A2033_04870 [Bacteroidetes bacterium GWA2_31_9]|nr:MAG: hypothetical protein A2033_04870 [Bacteroidetes bacterium GWA2_31_9]
MQIILIKILILLALITPILILSFDWGKKNYKNLLLFLLIYFVWSFFNSPLYEGIFGIDFISSIWNWEGKIFAFIFSILFVFIFRKNISENNFFTLKQNAKSLKYTLSVIVLITLLSATFTFFSEEKYELDFDTLAFRLTMPGLDEEFAFRGLMIAFLLPSLKPAFTVGNLRFGNPAVVVTAFLFGLVHGISFTYNLPIMFDYFAFTYTFIFGLIWGWMLLKSRSIVMPVVSHNLNNFVVTLLTMIK